MGRALFLGLSAVFFIGYSLVANAVLISTSEIVPIETSTADNCANFPDNELLLPGDPCYAKEARRIPIIGDLFAGVSDIISIAGDMFSGFFQLITFNAGLPTASIITALIFVPLGFINAFIIFTAVRGSG